MKRPTEEIKRDIDTVSIRIWQSVEQFRDMSSQLATLGRTTAYNWSLMRQLIDEIFEEDSDE